MVYNVYQIIKIYKLPLYPPLPQNTARHIYYGNDLQDYVDQSITFDVAKDNWTTDFTKCKYTLEPPICRSCVKQLMCILYVLADMAESSVVEASLGASNALLQPQLQQHQTQATPQPQPPLPQHHQLQRVSRKRRMDWEQLELSSSHTNNGHAINNNNQNNTGGGAVGALEQMPPGLKDQRRSAKNGGSTGSSNGN